MFGQSLSQNVSVEFSQLPAFQELLKWENFEFADTSLPKVHLILDLAQILTSHFIVKMSTKFWVVCASGRRNGLGTTPKDAVSGRA